MSVRRQFAKRFRRLLLRSLATEFDQLKFNQAKIWLESKKNDPSKDIKDHNFKVYSQWGDDGIIQFLIRNIDIANQTFIEFGVEDFQESNCRFLMMHDNWSGYVMDGSERKMKRTRERAYYWQHDLTARAVFITRENINELLDDSGFGSSPGIISIDIDGVDYWVFEQIKHRPAIFILEYNAVFGAERAISVPYSADFDRSQAHYSNLYYGASLSALTHAAETKGYSLVGCNAAGNNAYYVRDDLLRGSAIEPLAMPAAFVDAKFREGRSVVGTLSFAQGADRLETIAGSPVVNTLTGEIESL